MTCTCSRLKTLELGMGTCALKEDEDMAGSRRESNDSLISPMQ